MMQLLKQQKINIFPRLPSPLFPVCKHAEIGNKIFFFSENQWINCLIFQDSEQTFLNNFNQRFELNRKNHNCQTLRRGNVSIRIFFFHLLKKITCLRKQCLGISSRFMVFKKLKVFKKMYFKLFKIKASPESIYFYESFLLIPFDAVIHIKILRSDKINEYISQFCNIMFCTNDFMCCCLSNISAGI